MRLPGTRRRRITIRLSDVEWGLAQRAAGESGQAVGAWVGDLVARSGGQPDWGLALSRRDVVRQLVRVQLDLALAARVLREVEGADVGQLVGAALSRIDALVDGAVDGVR